MNPLRVWAGGYRTFDELELDLPSGCVAVVGPNGAGKSSAVNVIDLALFAEPGELASDDVFSTDHDQLELGLVFEHAGETYRVRRQLRRGKSATCDFEHLVADRVHPADDEGEPDLIYAEPWEPLTREKVAVTNDLISDTIGLTRASFRASAFMRQKDAGAFAEAQPRDRKDRLAEILQLERWEHRREQAATAARSQDTELTRLAGRAELAELTAKLRPEVERALAGLRATEAARIRSVEVAEIELERAQQKLAETAAAKERVRTCDAELQAATADERRARDQLLEAQQAKAAADGKQAELEQLTELASHAGRLEEEVAAARGAHEQAAVAERARDDHLAASARHRDAATRIRVEGDRLAAHHTVLADKLVELQHAQEGTERCDRCEQLLGAEAKQTAAASLQRELTALAARISEQVNEAIVEERLARETAAEAAKVEIPAGPDLARLETDLVRARDARSRQSALEQLLAGYREKTLKLPLLETELMQLAKVTAAKQTALGEATAAAGDTAELEQHLAAVRGDLTRARVALEEIRRTIAQQESQLQRVDEADAELAEILLKRKTIQAELDQLKDGEKAFGRDGVPAILVEAVAVPQIEAEANRVLEQLPMADGRVFRVELQTQAANKSNANVRETLDIVVVDRDARRRYESFSGGEQMRINLALRRALAQLLAHRRGAETRFLVIDEPDGLDSTAMQALPEILEQLISAGELDRILVVSHQDELATAFEQVLSVHCENGRSRIETGVHLEAVAA